MTTPTPEELVELAERLTDAQKRYLLALEPNRVDATAAYWVQQVEREFKNRTHRKELKRPGLDAARPLIRKGIVAARPEPCECGWHYASLTPVGLEVQHLLRARASQEQSRG